MKKIYTLLFCFALFCSSSLMRAQTIDTFAIQDFELSPATPTWSFTGPVIYNSGTSIATAAPPSSPIGIGASRAWETTTNSGGLILNFSNIAIATGYDSVRVHFNLAAMNLLGSTGGPDDLDYVLMEYSTDGGLTYAGRLRIRGAIANNSFWEYAATGVAKVYYLPTSEALFQPTTSGLQTAFGYSNCEIVFPGSVTQVQIRITCRSSSSTDTWLVDNVVITGEYSSTVGVSENQLKNGIKLFPNPTNDFVVLELKDNIADVTIQVLNALGQIISTSQTNTMQTIIALPEEKGVYFINVNSNNQFGTHKVVKQ
jgi:hypothetical protein